VREKQPLGHRRQLLDLFVQPYVLDRDRHLIGQDGHDAQILGRGAARPIHQVERANDRIRDHQGRRQERTRFAPCTILAAIVRGIVARQRRPLPHCQPAQRSDDRQVSHR
jgi:hypothetical protein